MRTYYGLLWRIVLLPLAFAKTRDRPPHIVLIVADDLGWNDVSWNNRKMQTPNLEELARHGVILNQHYVLPTCTPTRAALLTGRYPYKMGMQGHGIRHLEPNGLPLGIATLAEELKRRNYSTHAFGKWHLGYCNLSLTPTRRGFDTFRGYYLGSQDYFSHTASGGKNSPEGAGYDYWKNESVDYSAQGHYSTPVDRVELFVDLGRHSVNLFTCGTYTPMQRRNTLSTYLIADHVIETIEDKSKKNGSLFLYVAFQAAHAPSQVPRGYQANCSSHANKKRVKLCEMADAMDHAVGRIVKKLKDAHMWNNCLIVFMSDNGGQVRYGGNNWPLRGNKNTLYEGGTRVPAFVSGPLLKRPNTTSSSMMHVVDWFPTLLSATGVSNTLKEIDGVNQWPIIRDGVGKAPRRGFVYNFDSKDEKLFGAIRDGDMKLILRPQVMFSSWYSESEEHPENVKLYGNAPILLLYNITADPTEKRDLFPELKNTAKKLYYKLRDQVVHMVPSPSLEDKAEGHPSRQTPKGVFRPGWCSAPVLKSRVVTPQVMIDEDSSRE